MRMGWAHQAGHGVSHIVERLKKFNDTLPVKVTVIMEDAAGNVTTTTHYPPREGEDFLDALRRALDSYRK